MKKNEKGQALIELIIFLPLMVTLYSIIGGFASSINGSINQQKVTRAYFYYRIQNNSTFPGPLFLKFDQFKQFGMFFIGWRDYLVGGDEGIPTAACYRVSIPFKENPGDKCEEKYSNAKTLWIRVGTVYGVCGATLANEGDKTYFVPDRLGHNFSGVVDRNSCLLVQ